MWRVWRAEQGEGRGLGTGVVLLCLQRHVLLAGCPSSTNPAGRCLTSPHRPCPAAGDHVLEVGCGWGSFAMRAAQRTGCRVTGITVSKEQLAEATARVKAAGLADRVTLLFCDYRECPGAGSYDKVRGQVA